MSGSEKDQKSAPIGEEVLERVFLADDVIPNASNAFLDQVLPLEEAIKTANVVLDTNVLLLPYGAGSSSLAAIIKVLNTLGKKQRLFLPAQVAREFIRNRPNKLGELQQQLSDKMSRFLSIEKLYFPILEGTPQYAKLNESLAKTAALKRELAEASSTVVQMIKSWEWNDPVNTAYRDVFKQEMFVEPKFDRKEVVAELQRRNRLHIPPGYKDASKDDLGIGDFLIWLTILELGAKKKPLILVSGDEKADWQHRSGGAGFLPRYELLEEYRRCSGGQAFYIIPLSKLLQLLDVQSESVNEIKQEEERIQEANSILVDCPYCDHEVALKLSEQIGSTASPRCSLCEGRFLVHRTRNGVMVRTAPEMARRESDAYQVQAEEVACPNCASQVEATLGLNHNATTWCRCGTCSSMFPIHRRADGGVLISRANTTAATREDA